MIPIPFPHMALNSDDVPGAPYLMMNTWKVAKTKTAQEIVDWVAIVARGAPGGRLGGVVLNGHGFYSGGRGGYGISLGSGINRIHTPLFAKWSGIVGSIWITACGAARISPLDSAGDGDGNLFCCELAKNAGAYVYAATTTQYEPDTPPYGYIDDFEGLTLRYTPSGSVDWSHRYRYGHGQKEY